MSRKGVAGLRSGIPLVLAAMLPFCAAAAPADTTTARPVPAAPFAFADFSWVPGNAGASERPLTAGPFTGEFRLDDVYHYSFADPQDGTISGSSEVFVAADVLVQHDREKGPWRR